MIGSAPRTDRLSRSPLAALALAGLLALGPAPPAAADTELGAVRLSGWLEAGGRTTWLDGDDSRFERYRDLSDGVIGGWDLLFEDRDLHFFLHTTGWNVGYDSQRYTVEAGRYGWWKLDGFYGELPVVYSNNASTLFRRSGDKMLVLPPSIRGPIAGAAGAAAQSAALQSALSGAMPVDLEYRWLNGGGGGELQLTESVSLRARYQIHDKKGTRPFKLQFGSPGGTFLQLPGPIDEQIHEIKAGIDYAHEGCSFSLDYIGSLYQNDLDSLFASNPIVAADAPNAASRGRSSYAPDNQAHQFLLSGSASLPFGIPNRLSTSFGYQVRTQDDEFLPTTVNSTITTQPLSRGSLHGRVDTILGNVLFTARPADKLHFKARYRIYNFENKTESVHVPQHVTNDAPISTTAFGSVHGDYLRHNAETSLSYDLPGGVTPHLGFEWEYWKRSREREIQDLHEYGPALKLDWRVNSIAQVRADYRFLKREGTDYGTFRNLSERVGPAEAALESFIAQSRDLRKYTQADRNTHQTEVVGTIMPTATTEFSLSGGYEHEDYLNTVLGLTESQSWHAGADFGWQIHPRVSVSAWYSYENSRWEQDQRWRPRSFVNPPTFNVVDSPLNDWFSRTEDQYHTGGARLNVDFLPGRLDGEIGYVGHYGTSQTIGNGAFGLAAAPAPTTGGDGGNAVNWPVIRNALNAFTATLNVHVTDAITIRGQYRFEDYKIDDFTDPQSPFQANSNVDGSGTVSPSRDVFLGAAVNDYRAHILGVSAIFEF